MDTLADQIYRPPLDSRVGDGTATLEIQQNVLGKNDDLS